MLLFVLGLLALIGVLFLPMLILFAVFSIIFKVGKLIFKAASMVIMGLAVLISVLIGGSGAIGAVASVSASIMAAGVGTILIISVVIGCLVYRMLNKV